VPAIAAAVLWFLPSSEYIYLPDPPKNVAPLVDVPGETDADEKGGIYMVDIVVRKASLLERLFPGLHDGASLVPARQVNPVGVSESELERQSRNEMSQSQKIAAAVALRYLGHKVEAKPNGVQVTLVYPGAPADGKLQVGDVIVRANGGDIATTEDLRAAMANVKPGEQVTFGVRSSGGVQDVRLGTQADPQDRSRAIVGVQIQQSADIRLPVNVKINAGNIGGPSAGLAFALDIVDELGPNLDRGRRIAATGELDLAGHVIEIGGIKQKTIGAEAAGAQVFLVPKANAADAREYAKNIRIVAVSTFRQALSVLKSS
jgi:PDZ domain-containing protein